ncbi:uncharacterized protein LOC125764005 [Anopheles funestus]|uniref:uncharacterized protein LOC125764005 n=1 Tax=Anopheles funestus TaxID=62324 RepID=UPI0020C6447B|nr:uncharacterized protein LOC125764005 [Anopheles funestus]
MHLDQQNEPRVCCDLPSPGMERNKAKQFEQCCLLEVLLRPEAEWRTFLPSAIEMTTSHDPLLTALPTNSPTLLHSSYAVCKLCNGGSLQKRTGQDAPYGELCKKTAQTFNSCFARMKLYILT